MAELKPDLFVSEEPEIKVDAESAAAIQRGIQAADNGDVVSSGELRRIVAQWISISPNTRTAQV